MSQTRGQTLRFGPVRLEADSAEAAPYFLAGRKLYVVGTTSGALEPAGAEHLVGQMGGVWAHPVKFMDGWFLSLQDAAGRHELLSGAAFEGHLSDMTMRHWHGALQVSRTDFVVDDAAALFGLVELVNGGVEAWSGRLSLVAVFNILPSWFSGWECGGQELRQQGNRVVAWDAAWHDQWGIVLGSAATPDSIMLDTRDGQPTAELGFALTLPPGQRLTVEFLAACEHQHGAAAAHQLFDALIGRGAELLALKRQHYHKVALEGVALHTPDEQINADWILAKANLLMLEADYTPALGGYLLAGIPEYPQLFGCDNTYTTPGAAAAGFVPIMGSTLRLLAQYAQRACGRIPHEISTNGRVFNPGNTQETPQFAIAVWDYVRWTGDLQFLQAMYPICREGVRDYLPSVWGGRQDGYPWGDAMVERHGMGSRKLDSACYLYAAWRALAEMADVLERPEAHEYQRLAADWLERFERDWWIPDEGLYADSLHSDYRPQLDGHWTQVVPLQLGIARPERAAQVLDRLERDFTNQWGLVHTRHADERVWTLPTGLLVLAQLRYGRSQHAVRLLNNIALTARYGMLGAFKELIPEGLCFVQLWSAGLYLQCLLEGVLGLHPRAHAHELTIAPALPSDWPAVELSNLEIGQHVLNLRCTQTSCVLEHVSGPQSLCVRMEPHGPVVAPLQSSDRQSGLVFELPVKQTTEVRIGGGVAQIASPSS